MEGIKRHLRRGVHWGVALEESVCETVLLIYSLSRAPYPLKLCVVGKKQSLAPLFTDYQYLLTHTEAISARGKNVGTSRDGTVEKANNLFNYS